MNATGDRRKPRFPDTAASRAAAHGPGAWESLTLERAFDEHHALIFRVAYRMTGNAHDAEDVLQTVFLRLAARDAASAGIENAESYLRRAAVHASLNLLELRSRKDIPLDGIPEPSARGIDSGDSATFAKFFDSPSAGSIAVPPRCSPFVSSKGIPIRRLRKCTACLRWLWRSLCTARASSCKRIFVSWGLPNESCR